MQFGALFHSHVSKLQPGIILCNFINEKPRGNMKKSLLIILSLLCALVFGACKNQKEKITPKDLYYDIERIQVDIAYSPLKGLYDPEPFEQLLNFISLKEAGLVQKNGKVRLTLEAQDGTIKTLNCKATYPIKIKNWVKILPEKENQILRHFDTSKKYMVTSSEEKKTVYAQCNSCEVDESYKLQDWFSDIISELNTGKYNTLVFDLRYNPGGDGAFEMALNNELWKNKSELDKYNLAIVATGRTYSCSIRFINFVLMFYPQVVLFGEETGQAIFNYTGFNNGNNLKKLNCHFVFPQQLDDLPELQKRAREVTHSDIHCGVLPDVEVYEKFEDFMKGEDTIYNAIYDYFGGLPLSQ